MRHLPATIAIQHLFLGYNYTFHFFNKKRFKLLVIFLKKVHEYTIINVKLTTKNMVLWNKQNVLDSICRSYSKTKTWPFNFLVHTHTHQAYYIGRSMCLVFDNELIRRFTFHGDSITQIRSDADALLYL